MLIGILESRAKEVLKKSIEAFGAEVIVSPVVMEIPQDIKNDLHIMLNDWNQTPPDYFIFLNGSGVQYLFNELENMSKLKDFMSFMKIATVIVRGPKPAGVLQKYGIKNYHMIPSPYTSDLILEQLQKDEIFNRIVVIQHYGQKNIFLSDSLTSCGAKVYDICSYQWAIPYESNAFEQFIYKLTSRNMHMVIFTSSIQLLHLLTIAENIHQYEAVVSALNATHVLSIGPICSKTLRDHGIKVSFEVNPPKLYTLIDYVKNYIQSQE
jgi:uroporphyrinogen-III synthase